MVVFLKGTIFWFLYLVFNLAYLVFWLALLVFSMVYLVFCLACLVFSYSLRKKYAGLKNTLPPVVAVVTNMSYEEGREINHECQDNDKNFRINAVSLFNPPSLSDCKNIIFIFYTHFRVSFILPGVRFLQSIFCNAKSLIHTSGKNFFY